MLASAKRLSEETELAMEAARRGGEVLLRFWRELRDSQIREKSRGDLVTAADLASEQEIAAFLEKTMPEAAFVAEEGTSRAGDGPVWYVDPLDGTTNFVQQFPIFAVSVALADSPSRETAPLRCGVVYNPVSGELFYGARGRGSFLGTDRLRCSLKSDLGDTVIATGFPRRYHDELPGYLREFAEVFRSTRGVRRAGAAALDLCWTAQGIFDGFWEHRLSPWDVAAGALIVEEAGGVCSDFNGTRAFLDRGDILGAGTTIHPLLLALIQRCRT